MENPPKFNPQKFVMATTYTRFTTTFIISTIIFPRADFVRRLSLGFTWWRQISLKVKGKKIERSEVHIPARAGICSRSLLFPYTLINSAQL